MALTSAKAITSANTTNGITSAIQKKNKPNYLQNYKTNILPYTFWYSKLIRITFPSDLRKPCWITDESLSLSSKKCSVLENIHIYIISYRMRNIYTHSSFNFFDMSPKSNSNIFLSSSVLGLLL